MNGLNTSPWLVAASVLALLATSSACAKTEATEKLYDFDNKVHYYQTKLDDDNYKLEIQSDDYPHFANQSMFLLRHANRLCLNKTFMLKVLEGVQEYERFPTKPRAYQPALTVLLQCEDKEPAAK